MTETTKVFKVLGFISCKSEESLPADEEGKLEKHFCNTKSKIKAHFNTQMHKDHVNKIEDSVEDTKILRDGARDGKAATLRCARICFHLFKKGRPFSDYPELVAAIVAGGTFMGETNYSKEFPRHFLNSVAHVVKEKIKSQKCISSGGMTCRESMPHKRPVGDGIKNSDIRPDPIKHC